MAHLKDKVGHFFAWTRKGKEPVEVDVARRDDPEAPKEVSIQQIKQGYSEVVETMQSVRSHLEQQADRSEKMLELLGNLPDALRSMPDQARNQTEALESIRTHLENQNQTAQQLTDAITGLATASSHQQRSLSAIDQHLAEGHESRTQLNQGVGALTDTLGEVRASNAATRESMGAVVEQTRVNDERMREMVQRNQKMNTLMLILCLALATGALALGGYMAVLVSKVVNTPAESVSASAEPTSDVPPASTGAASSSAQTTPDFSSNAYVTSPAELAPSEPASAADGQEIEWVGPPAPE
ncbi:MAG: hypothetical protein AAGJ38_08785 [Planctomycetota bacterium]